ncbi:hypothetical protein QJS10_CPA06g01123 [Acorus calamus]|uniref:DNA helicase n=1 Tax=Acorus calamus TaxID=4465 RepID=A0AAV9ENW3_ACOCL|nr:hypothetical protein QJS10_CPA06g01123 [Acorus calamus]
MNGWRKPMVTLKTFFCSSRCKILEPKGLQDLASIHIVHTEVDSETSSELYHHKSTRATGLIGCLDYLSKLSQETLCLTLPSQELSPPPCHLRPPQHPPRHSVFVAVSTTTAAIGGQTLHSFIGIGTQSADNANTVLHDILFRNRLTARRWATPRPLSDVKLIEFLQGVR